MKNDFKENMKIIKGVMMTPDEQRDIKEGVALFMKHNPVVRSTNDVRHLLQKRSFIALWKDLFAMRSLAINFKPMMAIIILITLFAGGGTSYAAEQSLPGDVLYPVKVNVNEKIRGGLTLSEEARASLEARLAERRLEEAERLAAKGRLTEETRADIESRFRVHSDAFVRRVADIEEGDDAETSLELRSHFESSLKVHEHVLSRIAHEKQDARGEIETLLPGLRLRANAASEARKKVDAKISGETSVEVRAAAEGKMKAAEHKIAEVRRFITSAKASLTPDASAEADLRLKTAEEVFARGKSELEGGAYGKAFVSFTEAMRIAQQAKLMIRAQKDADVTVVLPDIDDLIDGDDEDSEEEEGSDADDEGEEAEDETQAPSDDEDEDATGEETDDDESDEDSSDASIESRSGIKIRSGNDLGSIGRGGKLNIDFEL